MPLRIYKRNLELAEWSLTKGSIDYILRDEKHDLVCSIKITHGKNTKGNEVSACSVARTAKAFKERGKLWPPSKKSKNMCR